MNDIIPTYNFLHVFHIRWWNAYGFDHHLFVKEGPIETHFAIAATLYEPEFSVGRVAYTKLNCLENLISHIFEQHESDHDITQFSHAVDKYVLLYRT
jgi:Terpene synthase family, metal binding domain